MVRASSARNEIFKYSVTSIRQIMRERKLNVIILNEVHLGRGKGKELARELRSETLECRLGAEHGSEGANRGVVIVWVPGRDPDGGGFPFTVVNVDARKDGRGLAVHFRSMSKNGGDMFMIGVYGVSAPVSSHLKMHESGVFWVF